VNALRQALLGETWLLPSGVAVLLVSCGLVLKPLLGDAWPHAGGPVLVGGALLLLVAAVRRGAGERGSRRSPG
jgi:hypothetical protein